MKTKIEGILTRIMSGKGSIYLTIYGHQASALRFLKKFF